MALTAGVIDLFAGPGGLGEGFSAYRSPIGTHPFRIAMSVEKESSAHKTLQLRAFYRQFAGDPPAQYFDYVKGEISRGELFRLYPQAAAAAVKETVGGPRALGDKNDDGLIHSALRGLIRKQSEPWVQIGGPPCQAYSLVGRARNRGIAGYLAEADHRHFLYTEYLRSLEILQPAVFVMENVKGILSSRVAGQHLFHRIVEDLSNPSHAVGKKGGQSYRLYSLTPGASANDLSEKPDSDWLVRSEEFGVPQARHRVILVGVREDIRRTPGSLDFASCRVSAGAVLADLPEIRSGLSGEGDSPEAWHTAVADAAAACCGMSPRGGRGMLKDIVRRAKRLTGRGDPFSRYSKSFQGGVALRKWLRDERLGGFVNHQSRGHMRADLARYLFCSIYARLHNGDSPRSRDFPSFLAPAHANWLSGKFADRFRVQAENRPSSTITSHISRDGHYYIHYDPAQCRSLTVREAARLQTFPDNYFFEGNRTEQYVQVGNAVPPWLARQIAEVIYRVLS